MTLATKFSKVSPFGVSLNRIEKTSVELSNWVNILTLEQAVKLYYGINSIILGKTGIVQNNTQTALETGFTTPESDQPESMHSSVNRIDDSHIIDLGSFGTDQAYFASKFNFAELPYEIYDTTLGEVIGYTVPGPFADSIPIAFGASVDEIGQANQLVNFVQRTESEQASLQIITLIFIYSIYTGNRQSSGSWTASGGTAKEVWNAAYRPVNVLGETLECLCFDVHGFEPPVAPNFIVTRKDYGVQLDIPSLSETLITTVSETWPSDDPPLVTFNPWTYQP